MDGWMDGVVGGKGTGRVNGASMPSWVWCIALLTWFSWDVIIGYGSEEKGRVR